MKRPSLQRGRLALAGLSTLTSLYLAQVLIVGSRPDRRAAIEALRRQGVDAYPTVMPLLFARGSREALSVGGRPTIPVGGLARKPTVDCKEENGDWLVYESDEHGFHNPRGLWETSPADVLALGDSFMAGACVPSEDNSIARIRQRYPATLNLGYGGNGPLLMLAGLRESLLVLRPAVVLWGYYAGNDLQDLYFERRNSLLIRYLEGGFSQDLLARQEAIDRALASYVDAELGAAGGGAWGRARDVLLLRPLRAETAMRVEDLLARISLITPRRESQEFVAPEEDHRLFESVLDLARREVEERGGRLYFVYLPAWSELHEPAERPALVERRRRVIATVRGLRLPLVDVLNTFERERGIEPFACRNCHYSSEGYALAAAAILEALEGAERLAR